MKGRRFSSSVSRQVLREGLHQHLEESALDREFKKWQARYALSLQDVSPEWQHWVYRVYLKIIEDGSPWLWEEFKGSIEIDGLHYAILRFLDRLDFEKQRDTWLSPALPDVAWPVHRIAMLQEVLATHTDPWCRELATKWLPYQTDVPSKAVEALVPLVKDPQDQVRWWSSIHLAHLSPDALVSAEPLVEALSRSQYSGWSRRLFNVGCTLRGEAAIALAQLGRRAWVAVRDFDAVEGYWSWLEWERPWDPSYDFIAARIASLIIQEDPDRLLKAPHDLPDLHYYWICWRDMGWAALRFLRLAEQHRGPHIRRILALTLLGLAALDPVSESAPGSDDWVPHLTLQTKFPRRLESGRSGYLSEALTELGVGKRVSWIPCSFSSQRLIKETKIFVRE